jgi:ketopantoate reductase
MNALTRLHILGGGSIGQLISHAARASSMTVTMLVRPTQERQEMLQTGTELDNCRKVLLVEEAHKLQAGIAYRFSMPYPGAPLER